MLLRCVLVMACVGCDPPRPLPPPDAMPPDAPLLCIHDRIDLAVSTLAGCEQNGTDDGDRNSARFNNPTNVEIGPDGAVYVTDFDSSRIRRVERDGTTTTIVQRDDLTHPFGIVLAPDGTLFVETDDNDLGEHSDITGTVWRVDPATGSASVVTRNAGRPRGLAMLPDGRIAMADHVHHVLTILDPTTGFVTPLAGLSAVPGHINSVVGLDARFSQPYDLVVKDGELIVSELDNHMLRRVTLAGVVTDYAGSGTAGNFDGPVGIATFDGPQGMTLAPDGSIYVTDIRRHFVRRIKAGVVSTVAGDGTRGFLDSDEPRGARFYGLEGIASDATRIIVSDGNIGDEEPFHRIRVIDAASLR